MSLNILMSCLIRASLGIVWDGGGKTNCNYLDKLQRHAVSIIEGRKIQHREINHTLSWLSLESCRKYQICLQLFKCLKALAPAYPLHDFHYSRNFHRYNTRKKDLLRLPVAKTTKYQSSFCHNRA